ncbi:MAG: hypothetical protein OEU57_15380 [Desulfuromonadales bacterium]|jgi:hypothetical protein|nr:hypothetical protein [Desulfuromonadales bacterium]
MIIARAFLIYLILSVVTLASCGTQSPGHITQTTSSFDGSKQLIMEPAWLYSSIIKLALFKSSKMPNEKLILTAVVRGSHIFDDDPSLHFNIDGETLSLSSVDRLRDIDTSEGFTGSGFYVAPSNWSSKDYLVDVSFLEKIITAEDVYVTVELTDFYAEGIFSSDAPITARQAFKDFLKQI